MSREKGLDGSLEQVEGAFGDTAHSDYITGQVDPEPRCSAH